MRCMKFGSLLIAPAFFLVLFSGNAIPSDQQELQKRDFRAASTSTHSADTWTQADWDSWLQELEAAYLAGMPEEQLYWWIENQLEALQAAEPALNVDLPDPYPGWGGSGGGGAPPGGGVDPYSSSQPDYGIQSFPCNPNAPGGCNPPEIQHPGIVDFASPTTIQEIRTFGATLAAAGVAAGNTPTVVVGASLVAVSEGLELWVLETDDDTESE